MLKIPKILISKGKTSNVDCYVEAIKAAGGEAVDIYGHESDEGFDGLLLAGGGDVAPHFYNEEMDGSNEPDELRDKTEFTLCDKFIASNKPIMGVCRGHQLLNVYFGGTLIQDIHTAKDHSSDGAKLTHESVAIKGSIVYELFGETPVVNTSHHQAIKVPGKEIKITQYSKKDGIIEAFEHESLPVFGVQWHPERMCLSSKREDAVDSFPIFEYFVSLCRQYMDENK